MTIPPEIAVRMGNFAPQEKKGITRIVAVRSFSSARVRVLIIAGTLHPNPMIMGMNALPETPKRRNTLSRMNATRAIYPLSSKTEKKRKRTRICGRKESTENKPPNTPSQTKLTAQAPAFAASIPCPASPVSVSVKSPRALARMTPGEFNPSEKKMPPAAVSLIPPAHSPKGLTMAPR